MRPVPPKMTNGWKREDKTGAYRPHVRATIQRVQLQRFPYDTSKAMGGSYEPQRFTKGSHTSIIFGNDSRPVELRGIKNYSWQRSLDQDVATCTLTLKNTELLAIGQADDHPEDFDKPGYLTYNRGIQYGQQNVPPNPRASGWHYDPDAAQTNRWGYGGSGPWRNLIVPDRMVKTYEGYGADYDVYPAEDPNLMISGTWLIDRVTYDASGDITLEMRDVGRMLLTHICFPPAIPYADYPLVWSKITSAQVPARDAKGGRWRDLKGLATATSSNSAYIGKGLVDPPYPYYVSTQGHVNGHHPNHALDSTSTNREKYWMSTGQTSRNSFVWWEMTFNKPKSVAALRIDPTGGPYRIYISVKTKDGWLGRKRIPYDVTTEGIDNGADIPFVQSVWADRWNRFDVTFKRKYRNVRKIRLTFTYLDDQRAGNYPWRAMLKDVKAYIGNYDDLHFGRGKVTKVVGNYRDYTGIVKRMAAWGGFWWPPPALGRHYWTTNATDRQYVPYDHYDPPLIDGRVWGTFQATGTAAIGDLTADLFDKKPFMDVINYVRDIVGFIFMIDEWGGVVWRMPNLYEAGNYLSPKPTDLETRARRTRTSNFVTIDEKETLLSYSTVLSSENLRERIFVANTTGKIGVVVRGFNPTYEGFRRTAGWTDQNFKNREETIVMADMIAAQQMFDYRRTSLTTPGYPAIQLDDQIRVYERVTNETYFHYVLGIKSDLNMETGEWTYELNTHWLGQNREDAWVIDVEQLNTVTKSYLNVLRGKTSMGDF